MKEFIGSSVEHLPIANSAELDKSVEIPQQEFFDNCDIDVKTLKDMCLHPRMYKYYKVHDYMRFTDSRVKFFYQ